MKEMKKKELKDISIKEQIFLLKEGKITISSYYDEELEVPEEVQLYLVKESLHNISAIKNPTIKIQKYVISKNPSYIDFIQNVSPEISKTKRSKNNNQNIKSNGILDNFKELFNNMFNSYEKLTKIK